MTIKKNYKIFIAGHNGMVGKSLVNFLRNKKFGKLILVSRKKLDLENLKKVDFFLKKKARSYYQLCGEGWWNYGKL